MTHGSLFSGIGGFDLAAEWMGWENKFHCEWNEFGQKVLHYYWPEAELFTDIKKSNFTKYANRIDVLSGGFPCQPYSSAGKRLGKEDDRHLWPEMLRAIREIRPRWVVGENVRGLTNWNGGVVFDEVQADLEAEGYEVTPFLLPACAVNAPHRRDRIWFVAYSHTNGLSKQCGYDSSSKNDEGGNTSVERSTNTKDINSCYTSTNINEGQRVDGGVSTKENGEKKQFANSTRICYLDKIDNESKRIIQNNENQIDNNSTLVQNGQERIQLSEYRGVEQNKECDRSARMDGQKNDNDKINRMDGDASYTNGNGLNQCNGNDEVNTSEGRINALSNTNESNGDGDASDTECERLFWRNETRKKNYFNGQNSKLWGSSSRCNKEIDNNVTDTEFINLQNKWDEQRSMGETNSRQSSGRFKHGNLQANWSTFPTSEPTICNGDDGISDRLDTITFPKWRNESIKAGGNAIVPQVVHQIFKAIEQYERINNTK